MITHMLPVGPCFRTHRTSAAFTPRFGFSEIAARGIWLAIKGGAAIGGLLGTVLAGIFGAVLGGIAGSIVGFLSAVLLAPIVALWLVSPSSQRHTVRTTAIVTGLGAGVLTAIPFALSVGPFAAVPVVFATWGAHRLALVSSARPQVASSPSPPA